MQIKMVSCQKAFAKPIEQCKICLTHCNANSSLSDSFVSSGASIAFKGNVSNSFSSKLLKLIKGKVPEAIKTASSRLAGTGEITPAKVVKKLNDQLAHFRQNDIEKIISYFSPKDKKLATLSLAHMSQWGRFESLNALASNLAKENRTLYSENTVCLANSIAYLKSKGSFGDLMLKSVINYSEIEGKGTILVDEFVLNRLSKDKELVNFIKQNPDIQLCYPDGWIHGINPFNQAAIDEVGEIVKSLTQKAKILLEKNGANPDEVLSNVLNESVISQLEKLGLKDRLKIITGQRISKDSISPANIAKQFEHKGISSEYLQKQLEAELPKSHRQLMLEAINSEAQIFDSRSISLMMKEQHKRILDFAKAINIPENNILYIFTNPEKSYGIIAQQYQATNKIPVEKFYHVVPNVTDKKMLVFLDDYAGSGNSISRLEHDNIDYDEPISNEFVFAPLVTTVNAKNRFNALNYIPTITIPSFRDSGFYKGLTQENKSLLDKVMVAKHGDLACDTSITFPHMAPDNNHPFFNEFISNQFLLNGKGAKLADSHPWSAVKKNI